eukprot:scaffold26975_cov135-Isochrysis_galbana.AAC.3
MHSGVGKEIAPNHKAMENNCIKIQQLPTHPEGLPPPFQTQTHHAQKDCGTNNRVRVADQPSTCRFCHKYVESSVHLGRCPNLKKIFGTINKALGFERAKIGKDDHSSWKTIQCRLAHKGKLIPAERDADWLIACSPILLHVPTSQ